MKTSKLKFLIAVLAITFAVTSAFTTSAGTDSASTDVDAFAPMIAYINTPSPCTQVSVDCSPTGQYVCTYQGQNVFDKLTPTICSKPLYRN